MKWIILAWGSWTRLYPLTKSISKQLLPIYDKPMIYYPLSTLMLSWIKEILIISTPNDLDNFKKLLWDWSSLGIKLEYKIQEKPNWIAEAFIIWEEFIWIDNVALILWDNIFFWTHFSPILKKSSQINKWAIIFWYQVNDPERFWVVEFDEAQNVLSIEEKPIKAKSNFAITWLYFYDNSVIQKAKKIKPSNRWELEITSINQLYLQEKNLKVELLWRWFAWLDTWTHESLLDASNFIETIEKRQWFKIACLEEIAYNKWWISKEQVLKIANSLVKTWYWKYLLKLIK